MIKQWECMSHCEGKWLQWKLRGAAWSWVNCNPMRGAIITREAQPVVPMTSSHLFTVFWEDNAGFSFDFNPLPLSTPSPAQLQTKWNERMKSLKSRETFGNPISCPECCNLPMGSCLKAADTEKGSRAFSDDSLTKKKKILKFRERHLFHSYVHEIRSMEFNVTN